MQQNKENKAAVCGQTCTDGSLFCFSGINRFIYDRDKIKQTCFMAEDRNGLARKQQ